MIKMIKIFISCIIFTISYCYSSVIITGNMQKFCLMNAGSFINNHYREIDTHSNILYSMSFIQYPAEIQFYEIFFQKSFDSYIISSNFGVLNYGILEDDNDNQFSPTEQKLELSIFNINYESFIYGASAGYVLSKIDDYRSSLLTYNIGFSKALFRNRFIIGMSIEDYSNVIENYSNISESYSSVKKISTELHPQFFKANITVDYLYTDINHSEYALGMKKIINKNFSFYLGKHFYSDNSDDVSIFDTTAAGIGLLINNGYKIDLGIQHLTDGIINIGTSLTVIK